MPAVDSRQSWIVACAVLTITTVSFGSAWITTVALTEIAKETGGLRTIPAAAVSVAWLGSGFGAVLMGRMYRRYGARAVVTFGASMLAVGLVVSTLAPPASLLIGHGLFIGFLGLAAINAPMYVYITQWFEKRRGSALALISSGSYLAGALWPAVFDRWIEYFGWRHTMVTYGVLVVVVVVLLALVFLKPAPEQHGATGSEGGPAPPRFRVTLSSQATFALLCVAALMCCIPMAMPQQHMVAFCGDLGISRTTGALVLSVLLGTAFLSRQIGGLISDKLGGLKTIFICSGAQALAMTAFLFTQTEAGLFFVAAAFGLGFSPIIPAYALVVREVFEGNEAYWRIPTLFIFTGSGMALGGWLAGVLYDVFGSYQPAFATGIAANIVNFMVIGFLVSRQFPREAATGSAATSR